MDAGTDAGSSQMVTVEMVYHRDEVDASMCPVTHQVIECRQSATVAESRVPQMKQDYAACQFFTALSSGAPGYRFECSNCPATKPAPCTLSDGGSIEGAVADCDFPLYTVADFCAWQLP
jgi:hypothetical protein